ncbi:hypothetical protein KGQ19_17655 [Catenulispora sp. NL8]|uniref:Uncharacterized protein n=1 Tax=Catenulispora pinistramenti TaxID=2705254 RepID=A0ABS5KRM1_9ACTN|nr:hypothetical protein [Catenulispora pinistramenti]MBS2548697.1 hypothetical protein [Catenulispora pinistramenti]
MDAPLTPQELLRLLDSMSFFQKRAIGKAGYPWPPLAALAALAVNPNGSAMAEAVLACHTDLLGREPRPGEAELAQAARDHMASLTYAPDERRLSDRNLSSGRGKRVGTPEDLAEIDRLMQARKERERAEKEAERAARRRK